MLLETPISDSYLNGSLIKKKAEINSQPYMKDLETNDDKSHLTNYAINVQAQKELPSKNVDFFASVEKVKAGFGSRPNTKGSDTLYCDKSRVSNPEYINKPYSQDEKSFKDSENCAILEKEKGELSTRLRSGINDSVTSLILSDPELTSKENNSRIAMSQNFFRIPRSIKRNTLFEGLPIEAKWLLVEIFDRFTYSEISMNDHGQLIQLQPFELLCTVRNLEKWTGIPKTTAHRFLNMFLTLKILGQRVGHTKLIISLLDPYRSELMNSDNGTTFGTRMGQEWDRKEEDKKIKEEKKKTKKEKPAKPPVSLLAAELLEFFNFSLLKNIPSVAGKKCDSKTAKYFDELLKCYTPDQIKEVINYAHPHSFWSPYILNPRKLNEKFPTLLHQIQLIPKPQNGNHVLDTKKYATEITNSWHSKNYRIDLLSKGVEITPVNGAYTTCDLISWDAHGFKDQLDTLIKKRGFIHKKGAKI